MNQQLTGRPESVKRTLIITLQVEETTRNQFMHYQNPTVNKHSSL